MTGCFDLSACLLHFVLQIDYLKGFEPNRVAQKYERVSGQELETLRRVIEAEDSEFLECLKRSYSLDRLMKGLEFVEKRNDSELTEEFYRQGLYLTLTILERLETVFSSEQAQIDRAKDCLDWLCRRLAAESLLTLKTDIVMKSELLVFEFCRLLQISAADDGLSNVTEEAMYNIIK
jgi:hypothetical protein